MQELPPHLQALGCNLCPGEFLSSVEITNLGDIDKASIERLFAENAAGILRGMEAPANEVELCRVIRQTHPSNAKEWMLREEVNGIIKPLIFCVRKNWRGL